MFEVEQAGTICSFRSQVMKMKNENEKWFIPYSSSMLDCT